MIHAHIKTFSCRDATVLTQQCTVYGASNCFMTDQSCPKRVRLVERLARAINKRKRMENGEAASSHEKAAAEQEVQEAMEAVRSNSAKDLCGGNDENDHSAA